ncbi:MAG: MBL fold metallo-hydrolase [Leptospiraceae bacterium]
MTKLWKWLIPSLLALIIAGYYVLFMQSPSVDRSEFKIDIEGMRELTTEPNQGASGPVALNSIVIGEGSFPSAAIVAGASLFSKTTLVFVSYQLIYADGSELILDTAQDESLHNEFYEGEPFYSQRFDIMQTAMKRAKWIVATHEHVDHVGGIAQSPFFEEIKDQVFLSEEQINGPTIEAARFPEGNLEKLNPLKYDGLHRIAPGVVLQKAPGHSLGSQLIYVRMQSGQEFLFIGDIAWGQKNITEQTGRPALVSWLFLNEDRNQVAHQLKALLEMQNQYPEIQLVVAHDSQNLKKLIQNGVGSTFQ